LGRAGEERGLLATLGFGTAVATWTAVYFCRFPGVGAPGFVTLAAVLLVLAGGGFVAGRTAGAGWRSGLSTGLFASLLNLLLVGSLVGEAGPGDLLASAARWIPGSLAAGMLAGTLGGALASRKRPPPGTTPNWLGALAVVAATATLLLLVAGGIVTGSRSGLEVPDWPNSYGHNMFLYPLAEMSGGIFYEHAHRLLGSLVGLTTLVLALHIALFDRRRYRTGLGLAALLLVAVQGFLGGMRVTGRPTWSASPDAMAPSTTLAIVHGVTGQLFFGLLVALAVLLSTRWVRSGRPVTGRFVSTDRALATVLVAVTIGQIVLGAIQRHISGGLQLHISVAAILLALAVATGARAWGFYGDDSPIHRTGILLLILAGAQMVLGILALVAVGLSPAEGAASPADVAITTVHQIVGAALLACAVALLVWLHGPARPEAAGER